MRDTPPPAGFTIRSFWDLQFPTGFAINDQNQTQDVEDLITLSNSEAVRLARFKFIKLTLDIEVSVTCPLFVAIVSDLCGRRKEIRVLVILIPRQYKSGVKRIGIGCLMTEILNRFWHGELPGWLDVLEGPRAETCQSWPDRRFPTSGRWDALYNDLSR